MMTAETPPSRVEPPGQVRQPIISVDNVSKQFGKDKKVVHGLTFAVQPGEIFCLLGPSGSGKSTTMRMLTGLYRPSEGAVLVFNKEPWRFKKKLRERLGYMPQQFVLFPELTVWGNVNFVASVYGMSWFGRRKKIEWALEFVDLWESRTKLASQLSGGMQRRLELAATLVHNPDLIFVDEPTAGIDPILRAKFWDHFRQLRDEGRTIFVTTQYVTEADYCDTVAILNRGRVLALGAPEEIRRNAFGGEIINVELENVSSQAVRLLHSVPGVLSVRFLNAENLQLITEDAGATLPLVTASLQEAGINIVSIEPYRPDFEEVFVELMEQDNQTEEQSHATDEEMFRDALRQAGVNATGTSQNRPSAKRPVPASLTTAARPVMPQSRPVAEEPRPMPPLPITPTSPDPNPEPMPEPTPIRPPAPILPTDPDNRANRPVIGSVAAPTVIAPPVTEPLQPEVNRYDREAQG